MFGQSKPMPKAIVATITRNVPSQTGSDCKIVSFTAGWVQAVYMSSKRNLGRSRDTPIGYIISFPNLSAVYMYILEHWSYVLQNIIVRSIAFLQRRSSSTRGGNVSSSDHVFIFTAYLMLALLGETDIISGCTIRNTLMIARREDLVAVAVNAIMRTVYRYDAEYPPNAKIPFGKTPPCNLSNVQ